MFNVNDVVSWTSQAGGVTKTKVGTVVEVLLPGSRPRAAYSTLHKTAGNARNHVSYIVKAGNLYYWPVVAKLQTVLPDQDKPIQTVQNTNKNDQLINFVGFSLDMSGSMGHVVESARKDYNDNLNTIKGESIKNGQQTYISVMKCGVGRPAGNELIHEVVDSYRVNPMNSFDYRADGSSTPLFDSVMGLIDSFEARTDVNNINASYLLMVVTDGEDNSSRTSAHELSRRIRALQATDRWTFVFRVPRGYKNSLINLGIPADNILEWELSSKGMEKSSQATTQAVGNFYASRAAGMTSSVSFYANLNADDSTIKKSLTDITPSVRILPVTQSWEIRPFVEHHGESYVKGNAFYQLTKPEDLQDYKEIIVQDKIDGKTYGGNDARSLLGLPDYGTIRLRPGNTGHYDVFVQSTSVNRKLLPNTRLLYRP